jgi:hypothetical protein
MRSAANSAAGNHRTPSVAVPARTRRSVGDDRAAGGGDRRPPGRKLATVAGRSPRLPAGRTRAAGRHPGAHASWRPEIDRAAGVGERPEHAPGLRPRSARRRWPPAANRAAPAEQNAQGQFAPTAGGLSYSNRCEGWIALGSPRALEACSFPYKAFLEAISPAKPRTPARSACDVQDGVRVTRVLFQFFDCFNRRQDQELDPAAVQEIPQGLRPHAPLARRGDTVEMQAPHDRNWKRRLAGHGGSEARCRARRRTSRSARASPPALYVKPGSAWRPAATGGAGTAGVRGSGGRRRRIPHALGRRPGAHPTWRPATIERREVATGDLRAARRRRASNGTMIDQLFLLSLLVHNKSQR